jgi:hypothetical protein
VQVAILAAELPDRTTAYVRYKPYDSATALKAQYNR